MAIVISIIIIVAYCVYDRERSKEQEKIKLLSNGFKTLENKVNTVKIQQDFMIEELDLKEKLVEKLSPAPASADETN